MRTPLPDQAARDSFCHELEKNFSIIAPAGVGKTTAIVERIASIAEASRATGQSKLASLVLVTYTNKSAQEMRERARDRLFQSDASELMAEFNQAFFGTIHSFCFELIRRWGHLLGLSATLSQVENKDVLWNAFLSDQDRLLGSLSENQAAFFTRFIELEKVCELAQKASPEGAIDLLELPPFPVLDFSAVLNCNPSHKVSARNAEGEKERLQVWQEAYESGTGWLGIPKCTRGGAEFQEHWAQAFNPLRAWLALAMQGVVKQIAFDFRQYRLSQGLISYDDMLALARELVGHPVAGPEIRAEGFHVILDEAQDTDPVQFDVLLGVAQDVKQTQSWREGATPPPGRFCMVGDPQQSIYSDRADLATYIAVHEALTSAKGGVGASFTVTMRCDQAVVDWVNAATPEALHGAAGQVAFVPLTARPDCGPGDVGRLSLQPDIEIQPRKTTDAAESEARQLARWLKERTVDDFGVRDWSEVALLCPRKSRLASMAIALEAADIPCQNHSRQDKQGNEPTYAWMAALITILAEPDNAFEVTGVLREVFGIKDSAIAHYVRENHRRGNPHPLSLMTLPTGEGPIPKALDTLRKLRREVIDLPLRSVVARIIEVLDLDGRLAAAPDAEPTVLNQMAALAAGAEESGMSLLDFAEQLELAYDSDGGEADPEPGKIQLLTCQKAKGLEWPVVILPYLFAAIGQPKNTYPRELPTEAGGGVIELDKTHQQAVAAAFASKRTVHSLERLLYVAMTRPRQRLILVDDELFFPDGKDSFAAHLRLREGEPNRESWLGLRAWQPCEHEVASISEEDLAEVESTWQPGVVTVPQRSYIRRILPSSLADHEAGYSHERTELDRLSQPDFPEIVLTGQSGVGYGNWWHGMMERMPWSVPGDWSACMQSHLADSPFAERGAVEIDLFLKSPMAVQLAKALCIRTEVPVLWRASEHEAYDGSIDLLAKISENYWLVVDWKTDRIKSDPEQELIAAYGPQLGAYQRALRGIFKGDVDACLYSTRTGSFAQL